MRLLLICFMLLVLSIISAQETGNKKVLVKQYNRTVTFDVRLQAVGFFSVKIIETTPPFLGYPKVTYAPSTSGVDFGGLYAGAGIAVRKRFHVYAIGGFEKRTVPLYIISTGLEAQINLLKSRFSPFINFGGGYLAWLQVFQSTSWVQRMVSNGAFALAGVGFHARITPFLSVSLGPDYRFIYFRTPFNVTDNTGNYVETVTIQSFLHQVGLHLSVIFY